MNRKIIIKNILYKLGIDEKYKAFKYMVSSIEYILDNNLTLVKVLYIDIAKLHGVSIYSVERCIRTTIRKIWLNDNSVLFKHIFYNYTSPPTNTEFLLSICHYVQKIETEKILNFKCPDTNKKCNHCYEILCNFLYNSDDE